MESGDDEHVKRWLSAIRRPLEFGVPFSQNHNVAYTKKQFDAELTEALVALPTYIYRVISVVHQKYNTVGSTGVFVQGNIPFDMIPLLPPLGRCRQLRQLRPPPPARAVTAL